jgi:hypothetical protein
MNLSVKSIQELRNLLVKNYGNVFGYEMSDEDINKIGCAILITTAEHLKIKTCSTS